MNNAPIQVAIGRELRGYREDITRWIRVHLQTRRRALEVHGHGMGQRRRSIQVTCSKR